MNKRIFCTTPLAATAAGVAVCLSAGTAHGVSGNVAASNGGTAFTANPSTNAPFKLFGSLANFKVELYNGSIPYLSGNSINALVGQTGGFVNHLGPGVNVSLLNFAPYTKMKSNQSNNYIGLGFGASPLKYGWVHCVSTNANGRQLKIDTWSCNASGGAIKTLDDSVTPRKLALSDGRIKLHWVNANEDGVARYEVQAKGANGTWSAVDSSTPGEGSYAATVASGEYRLMVENSDGSSRSINF